MLTTRVFSWFGFSRYMSINWDEVMLDNQPSTMYLIKNRDIAGEEDPIAFITAKDRSVFNATTVEPSLRNTRFGGRMLDTYKVVVIQAMGTEIASLKFKRGLWRAILLLATVATFSFLCWGFAML